MDKFIKELHIDRGTVDWEEQTVEILHHMGVTTIAQLFETVQINVTSKLETRFNVGYGMSLNMEVHYFFDLIRDLGSIDTLCTPVTGPENRSHVLTFGQKIVLKRFFRSLDAHRGALVSKQYPSQESSPRSSRASSRELKLSQALYTASSRAAHPETRAPCASPSDPASPGPFLSEVTRSPTPSPSLSPLSAASLRYL